MAATDPEAPQAAKSFSSFMRTLARHAPKRLGETRAAARTLASLTATSGKRR